MNDLLDWISRNNGAAFVLGVFIVVLAGVVADFFVRVIRAITGHYPAVTTVTTRDKDDDEDEDGA